MFTVLLLAVLIVGSASSHDGKCPIHDPVADQFNVNGQNVFVVEDHVIPTKAALVTGGQKVFVERTERIPGIKTSQVDVKTITGGFANIVDPVAEFPSVKTINTKTSVTEGQKFVVEKVEQPIIKTVPVENKVVVERFEQFPSVKTIPVDVKTFVSGQKFLTKEVDVPVEPKFDGHKIVKVVHISKESIFPTSQEAIYLGLSAGADKLFGGSKIDTSFSCHGKKYGYYADVKNQCKIYHVCKEVALADGTVWTQRNSFTCAEGTIFDQQKLSCVNFATAMDCGQSELFYEQTAKIFATQAVEKKAFLKEAVAPVAPVKSCCVYPSCAYVFPCAL